MYKFMYIASKMHISMACLQQIRIPGLEASRFNQSRTIQSITHQTISRLTKWLAKTTHLIKNPHWINSLDQWNTRQIVSPTEMGKRYQRKLKASKWIKFSKNKSSCIYIWCQDFQIFIFAPGYIWFVKED